MGMFTGPKGRQPRAHPVRSSPQQPTSHRDLNVSKAPSDSNQIHSMSLQDLCTKTPKQWVSTPAVTLPHVCLSLSEAFLLVSFASTHSFLLVSVTVCLS